MFRHAVRTLFALALAMAPALTEAALYRWVDELGVTHYATTLEAIPADAREDALEIIASPPPVSSTRAVPVPPAPEVAAPEPPSAPAPELAAPPTPPEPMPPESAPPAPIATDSPKLAPNPEPPAEVPAVEAPPLAPAAEPPSESQAAPPLFPGPPNSPQLPPGDPRAAEVAELESQIAADREQLRAMISTKRWDSAELASNPEIRAIAERLPRLQAELAALRAETVQ